MFYLLKGDYKGYIGVIWRYIGIMEKKMETPIMGYIGFRGCSVEGVRFRVYGLGFRV